MSFNNSFNNNSGGFILPSFTNVKPTVSVSDINTEVNETNSGDLESMKESDSSKNDKKDSSDTNLDGDKTNGNDESGKPVESNSADDIDKTSNTLKKILDNENHKELSKILVSSADNNGKGLFMNEESEDEDNDDDESSFDDEKAGIVDSEIIDQMDKKIDDLNLDLDFKSTDNNKSNVEENEDLLLKQLDNQHDNQLDKPEIKPSITHVQDSTVLETIEVPKPVIAKERKSNDVLIGTAETHPSDEITDKTEKDLADNSIANNFQSDISSMDKNKLIAEEPFKQLKLVRKISRTNSIKDIPNPPLNLKKQQMFDFQTFLAQFKSKDCEPVHKYLKSFLVQFNERIWTVEEQIKLLNEFQIFLFNKLIEYQPFSEIGNDEVKINNCKEGLEKLITTRIYQSIYSPVMSFIRLTEVNKNDKNMDKKFLLNTYLYDWIKLRNLDLNIKLDENFVELACKELIKIDEFKSPRDKIVCILNSSKLIFGLIRKQETSESADSFVPLLIYILIKSKVKHLYSNLVYIERFRNHEFLVGETSYYVSTMQIACNFIIELNKDQLTIEEDEYNENMKQASIRLKQRRNEHRNNASQEGETPSQVLTKSAEMVKQSLSNSINSILQNITSDEGINEEREDNSRTRHRRGNETSQEEIELIKQLSIKENEQLEQHRQQKESILQELKAMFPNVDPDLAADVLEGSVNKDGEYDVSACVACLLSLAQECE